MNNETNADCLPIEYLNATNAIDDDTGSRFIVVTVRLGLDTDRPFIPTNLYVRKEVAQRMVKDIQRSIRDSEHFR